jgi:hypothetical protein
MSVKSGGWNDFRFLFQAFRENSIEYGDESIEPYEAKRSLM